MRFHLQLFLGWLERDVSFHRWGSVANSGSATLLGMGASDTGESSLASATRARRKDPGRQEARRGDALTESLCRAVQYSTEAPSRAGMRESGLLVEDNTQEGFVDLKSAVVMNEAQFPEFVHEKVDSGARGADHLRQRFL